MLQQSLQHDYQKIFMNIHRLISMPEVCEWPIYINYHVAQLWKACKRLAANLICMVNALPQLSSSVCRRASTNCSHVCCMPLFW